MHTVIDLIKGYLKNNTEEYFDEKLSEERDIIMWVDWREEDDAIVEYCENILQTGSLSAKVNDDTDDEMGFEIIISYKGTEHKVLGEEDKGWLFACL